MPFLFFCMDSSASSVSWGLFWASWGLLGANGLQVNKRHGRSIDQTAEVEH